MCKTGAAFSFVAGKLLHAAVAAAASAVPSGTSQAASINCAEALSRIDKAISVRLWRSRDLMRS